MSQIQQDVKKYVRTARKVRGQPLRFTEFNKKYSTHLPEDRIGDDLYLKFSKSLKRVRSADGFPVQGPLFNILKAINRKNSPIVSTPPPRAYIPSPTATLKPTSSRSVQKVRAAISAQPYSVDDYKADLKSWLAANPKSKLQTETQVVYFVPNEKIDDYEHFASKLTKNTGVMLEKGGLFKMRSGLKREIVGIDKREAQNIIKLVKAGTKGPFFLPIACTTGAEKCICRT